MSAPSKRGRLGWLAAFVLLFFSAAWLMSSGERGQQQERRVVDFPRAMREPERERLERRRTLEAPKPARPQTEPLPSRPVPGDDPLLRAFSPAPDQPHLVLEANALRYSALGELLIDCLLEEGAEWLEQAEEEMGIDFIEDLDRIGISGENIFLTGDFSRARFNQLEELDGLERRAYGDHGTIYSSPEQRFSMATWRGELIVLGSNERREKEEAIDRLEGRSPAPPPFDESLSYGELYGVISAKQLRRLAGESNGPIFDRLAEIADGIELHLDAMHDVSLRAEVHGKDARALEELSRTLGGALSLARINAKASNDHEAAEFLSYAGVDRFSGGFAFELALPLEIVRKHLEEVCAKPAPQETAADLYQE